MIFILIYHLQRICGYYRILWFINHFRMRSIPFEFKRQCVNDVFNYLWNETFPFGLSCFSNQIMNSIGVYFWWPRTFFIDIWGGADWEQRTVQEPPTESLVVMLTLLPTTSKQPTNWLKDIFTVYQFTSVFVSNNSKLFNFDWNG
jgi:hypothetical protein